MAKGPRPSDEMLSARRILAVRLRSTPEEIDVAATQAGTKHPGTKHIEDSVERMIAARKKRLKRTRPS